MAQTIIISPLFLFCAILLLPGTICSSQMDHFYGTDGRQRPQQQQQQQSSVSQQKVGAVPGPVGFEQQQQQQRPLQQKVPNLGSYEPRVPLYGQQQHGNAKDNNNGTWSAAGMGAFGTALGSAAAYATNATKTLTSAFRDRMAPGVATAERSSSSSGADYANAGNVQVQVQLRSYVNPGFRLPDSRLCTCPAGNERCLHASPQRNGYNCLTSLAVFVLSADDTIHFEETPYLPLNAAGQLGQQQEFGTPFRFQLDSEPSAIAVVVHNLGPQINMDGTLYETNTVTVVDTFIQSLLTTSAASAVPSFLSASRGGMAAVGSKMMPPSPFLSQYSASSAAGGIASQQMHHVQLQGRLVGTHLTLAFSVSCRGPLVGPGCDLACNSSAANPASAICQSRRTGFFSLCRWASGGAGTGTSPQQVVDCKNCPWGIKEDAYCADSQGGVLEPSHAGVVSSSYYTAFIVLCCVCALLLLCMMTACLLTCKKIVRVRRDSPAAFRRHQLLQQQQVTGTRGTNGGGGTTAASVASARGDSERVLLTAACDGGTRFTGDGAELQSNSDNGGFFSVNPFRLGSGAEKGSSNGNGAAKHPPPPYSFRSNAKNATGTDQRHQTITPLADAASRTSPFPLPRSNTSTASAASGRETPSVTPAIGTTSAIANSSRERQPQQQQRFPPPLAIGTTRTPATATMPKKTLSPPRFQPLPHLGPPQQGGGRSAMGGASAADSLNSSFAGLPSASVSADV